MNAYEWGRKHGSCREALELRKNYATQEDWWRSCPKGSWMVWQLQKGLTAEQLTEVLPLVINTVRKAVKRSPSTPMALVALVALEEATLEAARWGALALEATRWGAKQADDLRAEIPEWIWG